MGCLSGEGLFLGTMIPVPCEVIHLIVHTQNNGSNLPQFLISDPWNKGQFGYSTIGKSGTEYFFQHDDLKLSTKSCFGSVPCVTLLFLEVFGPEKKNGQVN